MNLDESPRLRSVAINRQESRSLTPPPPLPAAAPGPDRQLAKPLHRNAAYGHVKPRVDTGRSRTLTNAGRRGEGVHSSHLATSQAMITHVSPPSPARFAATSPSSLQEQRRDLEEQRSLPSHDSATSPGAALAVPSASSQPMMTHAAAQLRGTNSHAQELLATCELALQNVALFHRTSEVENDATIVLQRRVDVLEATSPPRPDRALQRSSPPSAAGGRRRISASPPQTGQEYDDLDDVAAVAAVARVETLDVVSRGLPLDYRRDAPQLVDASAMTGAVTSIAASSCGLHLLFGDRNGDMTLLSRPSLQMPWQPAVTGLSAYVPFVDPLSSVEVGAKVTSVAFLPQCGPTLHFLSTNERIPKLWRVCKRVPIAKRFRAVDLVGTRSIGPLSAGAGAEPEWVCAEVVKYGMEHENNVHSICPTVEGENFYTVDELSVRFWSVEHNALMSLEVASVRPPGGAEIAESLTSAKLFADEPNLLFLCSSAGLVRVVDRRIGLRCLGLPAAVLENPQRSDEGAFSAVAASLTSVSLSPGGGRYLCGKDFVGVTLWDMRRAGSTVPSSHGTRTNGGQPLRRWQLQSGYASLFEDMYQSSLMFERSSVAFIGTDGTRIATGTIAGEIAIVSTIDDAAQWRPTAEREGVEQPSPTTAVPPATRTQPSGGSSVRRAVEEEDPFGDDADEVPDAAVVGAAGDAAASSLRLASLSSAPRQFGVVRARAYDLQRQRAAAASASGAAFDDRVVHVVCIPGDGSFAATCRNDVWVCSV